MVFISLLLEVLAYSIKIILLLAFWLVVVESFFNWFKVPNKAPLVKLARALVGPPLLLLRRKFPFLLQQNIDFTPLLALFIIIFLHLAIVNTLFEVAFRLK